MSGAPSTEDLARQLAVLEERMNTKQAEYKTDIAQLASALDSRMSALDGRMSKLSEEMAKRETRLLLAGAGLVSLAVIVLGFLIRLPA